LPLLQHIGQEGYEKLIDYSLELGNYFTQQVKARTILELASEPETNICCFRWIPQGIPSTDWDIWNLKLLEHLLHHENTFLSFPLLRGKRWLRAVLLNPFTTKSIIDELFDKIDHFILYHSDKKNGV
jgi:glutamate/tyrosine decarboxylase-like PLP-dependent enzyme